MRTKLLLSFLVRQLLLLFLLGGVAFVPAAPQVHTTAAQMASVHRDPLCPGGLPCI